MRKAIHHTAMPDEIGKIWFPKPSNANYRFMDWLVNYQNWQLYIKKIKIN